MMKHSSFTLTLLTWLFCCSLHAAEFKREAAMQNGMLIGHTSVPKDSVCNLEIPEAPLVYCTSKSGRTYYSDRYVTGISNNDLENHYKTLIQVLQLDNPKLKIINQSRQLEINSHLNQEHSKFNALKEGNSITYSFDMEDSESDELGVFSITLHTLQDKNTPLILVLLHGVSTDKPRNEPLDSLRNELVRFVHSFEMSNKLVKKINRQTAKNRPNLGDFDDEYSDFPRRDGLSQSERCNLHGVSYLDYISGRGKNALDFCKKYGIWIFKIPSDYPLQDDYYDPYDAIIYELYSDEELRNHYQKEEAEHVVKN